MLGESRPAETSCPLAIYPRGIAKRTACHEPDSETRARQAAVARAPMLNPRGSIERHIDQVAVQSAPAALVCVASIPKSSLKRKIPLLSLHVLNRSQEVRPAASCH